MHFFLTDCEVVLQSYEKINRYIEYALWMKSNKFWMQNSCDDRNSNSKVRCAIEHVKKIYFGRQWIVRQKAKKTKNLSLNVKIHHKQHIALENLLMNECIFLFSHCRFWIIHFHFRFIICFIFVFFCFSFMFFSLNVEAAIGART